jgi:transposase
MSACPHCSCEQSWKLGDGRYKCHDCGRRYSWRSVWESVRLTEAAKMQLLSAFVQGASVYSQRNESDACVDTKERFYRLIRACCAIDSRVSRSAFALAQCRSTPSQQSSGFRGWTTATRVLVLSIAEHEGSVVIASPHVPADASIPLLRERTAVGGVWTIDHHQALANLQVRGRYVIVNTPRRRTLGSSAIEEFWDFAKDRLRALRKIPCDFFHLYLGEMCFRFNHRHEDLLALLTDRLRTTPIQNAREIIADASGLSGGTKLNSGSPKTSGTPDVLPRDRRYPLAVSQNTANVCRTSTDMSAVE